ncbi:virulence factor BrkB family protein, partial [Yersinia enterocolitica]
MASFLRFRLSASLKPYITFGRMLYTRIDKDGLTMLAG